MARNEKTRGWAIPAVPSAVDDSQRPTHSGQQSAVADAQTSAILTAVENQLTRYFGAMAARADAAQHAGEAQRAELVTAFQQQISALKADLDRSRQANDGYEQVLHAAIEDRLNEFAVSQNWRFSEVESRLERVSEEISLGLPTQMEAATVPLQQRFDRTTELLTNRIEDLHKAARLFDEQSSAIVQHVNDTSSALSRRIDETGRNFSGQLDERTMALSQRVDDASGGMRQHVSEQVSTFGRRIEETENKVIDRALAMEERINEQTGVRLASAEAAIGRISNGIDEAIVALSHRVIELENANDTLTDRIDEIASQIASVDQEAIDQLREQMSSSVGESMLVRIELERVASSTGEQFDKLNVRLAELAADISDSTMDVSTAVQLERLEEIERALVELDPDQFVRKSDVVGTNETPTNEMGGKETNGDEQSANDQPTSSQSASLHPQATVDGTSSESNLSSW